jgi:Na+/H+ antiporter NhaD/arsenite permease-like protein
MIRILVILITLAALSFVLVLLFSKKQKPWNEMTEKEKNKKKIMIASGTTVFLAGVITTLLLGKKNNTPT